MWKLEEQIYPLVEQCAALLSDRPLFFLVNSYTAGLSPSVMKYILNAVVVPRPGEPSPPMKSGFLSRRALERDRCCPAGQRRYGAGMESEYGIYQCGRRVFPVWQ